MIDDTEIWTLEREFWLSGADFFTRTMARNCLMVFPDPVGILTGPNIPKTLKGVPRWSTISMTEQRSAVDGATVTLVYRAEAVREGEPPYRALCSSTYVGRKGKWRLLQHQQTPLG